MQQKQAWNIETGHISKTDREDPDSNNNYIEYTEDKEWATSYAM